MWQKHHNFVPELSFFVAIFIAVLVQLTGLVPTLHSFTNSFVNQPLVLASKVVWWVEAPIRVFEHSVDNYVENELLKHQLVQLQASAAEVQKLREENEALRELMALPVATGSAIRGVPITSYAQPTVAVNSNEGIRQGSLVSNSGILLGLVKAVEEKRVTVTLVHEVPMPPILVRTDTGAKGILKGTGRRIEVSALDPKVEVPVGSRVTTVGQPGIPAGVLIGTIQELIHNPTDPEQKAVISSPVSFYDSVTVDIDIQ